MSTTIISEEVTVDSRKYRFPLQIYLPEGQSDFFLEMFEKLQSVRRKKQGTPTLITDQEILEEEIPQQGTRSDQHGE